MKKQRWEESEKRREEKRREGKGREEKRREEKRRRKKIRKEKEPKKEDADGRKRRKVAKHSVFPMFCGAKAAGAEPSGR